MEERIIKLEEENKELKKIIASMLNAMATISESTSKTAMKEVEEIINYCNILPMFQ